MSKNASGSRKRGPTTEAPTRNKRVTARIVREDDGTTHTEYRVSGRVYGSLEALKGAPQSTHGQAPRRETHVVNNGADDV
jgi:hypothetical protein